MSTDTIKTSHSSKINGLPSIPEGFRYAAEKEVITKGFVWSGTGWIEANAGFVNPKLVYCIPPENGYDYFLGSPPLLQESDYFSWAENHWVKASSISSVNVFYRFPKRPSYEARQKAAGFQVGDRVRVVRVAKTSEDGWHACWTLVMDSLVDKEWTIKEVRDNGIILKEMAWNVPFFILEKIEKPLLTAESFQIGGPWWLETKEGFIMVTKVSDFEVRAFADHGRSYKYTYESLRKNEIVRTNGIVTEVC